MPRPRKSTVLREKLSTEEIDRIHAVLSARPPIEVGVLGEMTIDRLVATLRLFPGTAALVLNDTKRDRLTKRLKKTFGWLDLSQSHSWSCVRMGHLCYQTIARHLGYNDIPLQFETWDEALLELELIEMVGRGYQKISIVYMDKLTAAPPPALAAVNELEGDAKVEALEREYLRVIAENNELRKRAEDAESSAVANASMTWY